VARRQLPIVRPGEPLLAPAEGPPPFARIGVVGLGLVGGSVALACRQVWPSSLVIGVDRNDVLEHAMVRHAVDVGADDLVVLAEADLVVLAAPVEQNIELLAALPSVVRASTLVTDVGSTKRSTVSAAERSAPDLAFIGGHPMAGAAKGGIEHASAGLFKDRPWILTPGRAPEASVATLARFVEALGARARVMTSEAHDHLVAYLSHLPQIVATVLMRVVGDDVGESGLALAGRGLADTTRLASSPAPVWADICASNADEIARAIERAISGLEHLRGSLGDRQAVSDAFEAAAAWREQLVAASPPRPDDGGTSDA
jgi:prephenate dehydrogenase